MSSEYINISDKDYTLVESMIRKSYPNSCILWIERIRNYDLEIAFNEYSKRVGNVRRLFHGSTEDAIKSIIVNGFDPSYNRTSAYGKGTYFAIDASYSRCYMKKNIRGIAFMLIADVALGKNCCGSAGKILPSSYDSFVDNIHNPSIVVVNKIKAALPLFAVAFYPDARF